MISVIIPTLNEESNLKDCLGSVGLRNDIEKIVVDGGSSDFTTQIAKKLGCKVFETRSSRAQQMNLGAEQASGHIFLFLHADTLLPEDWFENVLTILQENQVVCGAFSLSMSGNSKGLKAIEILANLRSRFFQIPYGDQALFLTKNVFKRIGGFPDRAIMEDFEFVTQLKKIGKIQISNLSVKTSDRRWKKLGLVKTTLINQIVIVAYLLGFSRTKLRKFYDDWS